MERLSSSTPEPRPFCSEPGRVAGDSLLLRGSPVTWGEHFKSRIRDFSSTAELAVLCKQTLAFYDRIDTREIVRACFLTFPL